MNSKFGGLGIPVDKPARMTLIHPTTNQPLRDSEGKEAYLDLYSTDSEVARRHFRAANRNRTTPQGRPVRTSPEADEAAAVETLVALTAGWYLVAPDGKPFDFPFNAQNAREVYAAAEMSWVRLQVNEFVTDLANFAQASSKN
jgi:hypothetical protein